MSLEYDPYEDLLDDGGPVAEDLKDFTNASIRAGFIRKVYGILSVQLVITAAIVSGMLYQVDIDPTIRTRYGDAPLMATLFCLIMVLSVRCCCESLVRTFPYNYIFLLAVTLLESYIVGFIASFYTGASVAIAAGMTAGIFLGLTMYAMTTETDFTGYMPYIVVASLGFLFMGMSMAFILPDMNVAYKVYSAFGAILFSCYIVFDTQLIVGGKHRYKHNIDDYAFAALNLYMDIINLFLRILNMTGERR